MKKCLLLPALLCLIVQPLLGGSLQERVREAALVTYVHGMTAEIAEQEVGSVGVPYLLELLKDAEFERRDNVVAFLIFLANDGDAAAIGDHLDHPPVLNDSPEDFRAKLLVPEALGRIASRGGAVAEDILQRLQNDPEIARSHIMAERVAYGMSLMERNTEPAPDDPVDPDDPSPLGLDTNPAHHVHDLDYANHVDTNQPINDTLVDALLQNVTQVVGTENASNDTGCCIEFLRTEPGVEFGNPGDGLDVITTAGELNLVINNPAARVKVVDYIGYCSGPGPNIIGCGETPGNGMVVVRVNGQGNEGKLWAHEFGHNTGLGHNPTFGFIMYGSLSTSNTKVNTNECNRYHNPFSAAQANPLQIGVCHDFDDDNIMSTGDNCPDDANAAQQDADLDWVGDICDNCAGDPNTGQEDCDTDGSGDVCDPEIFIPEAIDPIWFVTNEEITWDFVPYRKNIYKGSFDGVNWHTSHVLVAVLNSETSWSDPTIPNSGTMSYYLVTAFNSCGESP